MPPKDPVCPSTSGTNSRSAEWSDPRILTRTRLTSDDSPIAQPPYKRAKPLNPNAPAPTSNLLNTIYTGQTNIASLLASNGLSMDDSFTEEVDPLKLDSGNNCVVQVESKENQSNMVSLESGDTENGQYREDGSTPQFNNVKEEPTGLFAVTDHRQPLIESDIAQYEQEHFDGTDETVNGEGGLSIVPNIC